MEQTQHAVRQAVDWTILVTEAAGALTIGIGVAIALIMLVGTLRNATRPWSWTRVRLVLGSYLVLGIEFQLAADILKTAIAPSFTEIGQLAAIAGIRTVLNYFLTKEIAEEKAELGEDAPSLPTIRH